MASVEDFIDRDGVLRSLLSKSIDNTVYALYPKTHADVVKYKESTVQFELDHISDSLNTMHSSLSLLNNELNNVSSSVFNKEYMNNVIDKIKESITENTASIINIQQDINNMSYYTQDEVTQKIISLSQDTSKTINYINTMLTELSNYVNLNFITKNDLTYNLESIKQNNDKLQENLEYIINNYFNQVAIDMDEIVNKTISRYYKFDQIDSSIENIHNTIDNINENINVTKGEYAQMNSRSENNITDHLDQVKKDINANTNLLTSRMNNFMIQQANNQQLNYIQTLSTLGGLNIDINNKLDSIINGLSKLGVDNINNTENTKYQLADLEVF